MDIGDIESDDTKSCKHYTRKKKIRYDEECSIRHIERISEEESWYYHKDEKSK